MSSAADGKNTGIMPMVSDYIAVWLSRHTNTAPVRIPVVYLDITSKCNSACVTCNVGKSTRGGADELTTDEITSLIPGMKQLGVKLVSIGGGEPTMRDDLVDCIAAFRNCGIRTHMNTNGLAVTASRAKELARAGLSVVHISLDSADRAEYEIIRGVDGLEAVLNTIKYFRSCVPPVPVGINVTLTSLNENSLRDIVEMCVPLDVSRIQFTPVHAHMQHRGISGKVFDKLKPVDMTKLMKTLLDMELQLKKRNIRTNSHYFLEHLQNAYRPVRTVPCVAGFLFVIIDSFGNVMPCYEYASGGNIRKNELVSIINSPGFKASKERVKTCVAPCLDVGSAEPAIGFHLPYICLHPYEIYCRARQYF